VDEDAARVGALDIPSLAATKQRIDERAIAAIREAVRRELQAAAVGIMVLAAARRRRRA
jgi:hypothetical protein